MHRAPRAWSLPPHARIDSLCTKLERVERYEGDLEREYRHFVNSQERTNVAYGQNFLELSDRTRLLKSQVADLQEKLRKLEEALERGTRYGCIHCIPVPDGSPDDNAAD